MKCTWNYIGSVENMIEDHKHLSTEEEESNRWYRRGDSKVINLAKSSETKSWNRNKVYGWQEKHQSKISCKRF